ncbi:MAG TPA: phosphoglycerate kinase, partial [Sneathiellales bacterium]|nr:phosphoglycerate kinase [Sneathiellales bacterium]
MTAFKILNDLEPFGLRVLVRVDLNLPMENGQVSDRTRIEAARPTVRELVSKGAKVILLAHFGRPKGQVKTEFSLSQVIETVAEALGHPVRFASDCIGTNVEQTVADLQPGDILLLENVRFHPGEESNDPAFVEALARLGDAYVNDAFSCAHRAHASSAGLAGSLPAYAGRALERELTALAAALTTPERPVAAVVGGAKVSSKLALLGSLVERVDHLIIGGGMANTFLFADGLQVGKSLCERDLADTARAIVTKATAAGCKLLLPRDVVVAEKFKAGATCMTVAVDQVPDNAMILDVGPDTVTVIEHCFAECRTVVWNGPLGAFET